MLLELRQPDHPSYRTAGYKPEYGAREMGRVIQEHVKKPLADTILFGELAQGGMAEVQFVDGEIKLHTIPKPVDLSEVTGPDEVTDSGEADSESDVVSEEES